MRFRFVTRPVLFCAVVSPPFLPTLPSSGPLEPGADLSAGIRLLDVHDAGSAAPRALVQLDLRTRRRDAVAEVTSAGDSGEAISTVLARTNLTKGRLEAVKVESELEPGRENHLYFRVTSRGADGSTEISTVYLRVNLDPGLEPQLVGDYWQYQGWSLVEDPS